MKNPKLYVFFTLIIGFPLFSFAQTIKQFNGLFDVSSVKSSGANYEIVGTFSDLSGVFTATGVMVGDQIVDVLGNAYEIVTITSISGAKISTISSSLNGAFPSGGGGIIYRPSTNGYPLITNSTPAAVLNTVMNTVTLSVTTDLPSFQSGETLPSSGYSTGAIVILSSNSQLYRLGSAGWIQITSAIPTSMATSIASVAVQPSGNLIYLVRKATYYVSDGTAWSAVSIVSELPGISKFGDIYYETDEKKLYMMSTESVDGSIGEWVDISGGGIPGGGEFDFPDSPSPGDLFFNIDNNTLYMSDANALWVEVSTNGSNPAGFSNPDISSVLVKEGQLFYNSSEHNLYVFNGIDWIPVGNSLANGQIYVGSSSNVATPVSMTGDASLMNSGKITINNQAVTDAKLDKSNIPLSGFGNPVSNINMGDGITNYKISNLQNPSALQDAVTKAYIDNLFSNPSSSLTLTSGNLFVGSALNKATAVAKSTIPLSGFGNPTVNISMNGKLITNLAAPSNDADAVNKLYVDSKPIWPINIGLDPGMLLMGNSFGKAGSVETNEISVSAFGAGIADVSLGGFKITNLADPSEVTDAATKNYVDTKIIDAANISLTSGNLLVGDGSGKAAVTLKNSIPLSGFGAATANISMGTFRVVSLGAPVADTDASTKKYVDDLFLSPSNILSLSAGSFFVGNAFGKAAPTLKTSIPVSGFGKATETIYMGDPATQYNISYLAEPMSPKDAATKNYVDTKNANPGSITLAADNILVGNVANQAEAIAKSSISLSDFGAVNVNLSLENYKITNLADPVNDLDAVNKKYITTQLSSVNSLLSLPTDQLFMGNVSGKAAAVAKNTIPVSNFGAATANLVLGNGSTNYKITNLSDPTVDQDATTKKYVDGLVAGVTSVFLLPKGNMLVGDDSGKAASTAKSAITLSGFKEAEANISMGSGSNNYKVINLADPSGDQDAATKKYVDNKTSGLTTGTTPPTSPVVGSTYYNTTEKVFYVYDDTQWVPVDNMLANGQLFVGDASNIARAKAQSVLSLSGFGVPTADLSAGSFKITNLSDPTVDQDASTKKYVDDLIASSGSSALADGKIFVGDVAGVATPVSLSGDATIDNTGKMSIADDAVSAAKLNADVAGSGLKQNVSGALEVDVTTIAGGSISSADLLVIGGSNAALTNVVISIPDKAITDAKLDKTNIPLSGFAPAGADIQLGNGTTNFKISNLLDPTADQDATTKKYVDSKTAGLTTETTPPVSPKVGSTYYNTSEKVFYVYDGTQWVPVDNKLANGQLYVGDASNIARATAQSILSLSGFGVPTADLSAGSFKITNLSDPTVDQDATTKKYVDGLVAGVTSVFSLAKGNMLVGDDSGKAASTAKSAITLSGFKEAEANISMGSGSNNYKIINLADPTGDQDAATKKYVDITAAASKDNLGNHTATGALKMGSYSVSNDGDPGEGVAFDTDGHATFGKDVTVNGNFYTPSDERLKTDIETLTNVLEKINNLRGVQFEYKDQKKYAKGPKMGVIAQELLLVYPEMVTKGDDGYLKVDYTQLTGVLIQAVKEQQMQINMLKTKMATLQEQINEILQKIK